MTNIDPRERDSLCSCVHGTRELQSPSACWRWGSLAANSTSIHVGTSACSLYSAEVCKIWVMQQTCLGYNYVTNNLASMRKTFSVRLKVACHSLLCTDLAYDQSTRHKEGTVCVCREEFYKLPQHFSVLHERVLQDWCQLPHLIYGLSETTATIGVNHVRKFQMLIITWICAKVFQCWDVSL